jgi:hypothetical protein
MKTTILIACIISTLQAGGNEELARRLANGRTREQAVAEIQTSGASSVPVLLKWAQKPPPKIDEYDLDIGLAEVFGQLRVTAAIPFLVSRLGLQNPRFVGFSTWLKTEEVIEKTFPALSALIKIGPDASRAVIEAYPSLRTLDERIAAMFVVSHVTGVPEARDFFIRASGAANTERIWAERGLSAMEFDPPPFLLVDILGE